MSPNWIYQHETVFRINIKCVKCIDLFVHQVVQLISAEILPFANFIPKEFVGRIMSMLNKGSIHSQSSSFTGTGKMSRHCVCFKAFLCFKKVWQLLSSTAEAEMDVRMREEFSKVCFETLLQFSFSNKVTTPQEGYISRMALSVLLQRAQDVLRRYVEDERLSGRCPLPRWTQTHQLWAQSHDGSVTTQIIILFFCSFCSRQQVTEIIFVLKAISTLMDSLNKTQPENGKSRLSFSITETERWASCIVIFAHLCLSSLSHQWTVTYGLRWSLSTPRWWSASPARLLK